MKTNGYFEIPNNFMKSQKGSSPRLLTDLINHLKGASEIKISFFLYNNPYLHKFIEDNILRNGGKVIIYTIPLDGYDKQKSLYVRSKGKERKISKWDYAKNIFTRIFENDRGNIELRFVPHTNLWHEQRTSRGSNSYALHNKSILASYPDGSFKCISSSSNFALGDPRHSENFLITDQETNIRMFKTYFHLLHQHSIGITDYLDFRKTKADFEYITHPTNLDDEFSNCYFTAPFIKYNGVGSNHYVQHRIIEFIKGARERLYFCFQHFSDIDSFDRHSKSIVEEVCNIASQNSQIDIKVLKQTRYKNQAQGKRTQRAEKALKKFNNITQKYWFPAIHDKFIIADNKLMVTTANLTCTQFAWAENHHMIYLDGKTKKTVINTFSDINSFHFVYDQGTTRKYKNHFNMLWEKATLL